MLKDAVIGRTLKLTWLEVVVWFSAILVVSTLGTYLSYHGPLSSETMRAWGNRQPMNPVNMDVLRLVLGFLAALYILWGMGVFSSKREGRERLLLSLPLRRYEWWACVLGTGLLLVFALVFQPLYGFRQDLVRLRIEVPANTFQQITRPYLAYVVYMGGLWLGVVLPVFLLLVRSISLDRAEWRRWQTVVAADRRDFDITPPTFQGYVADLENYILFIKDVVERYFPVFLAVITLLVLEQFSALASSSTPMAADVAKTLLWLVWMPAAGLSVYILAKAYEDALAVAKSDLGAFIERLRSYPDRHELLDRVIEKRGELDRKRGPVTFLFSVFTGGRVMVYALGTVIVFLIKSLSTRYEDLARAFFPGWLVEFISNFFRHQ